MSRHWCRKVASEARLCAVVVGTVAMLLSTAPSWGLSVLDCFPGGVGNIWYRPGTIHVYWDRASGSGEDTRPDELSQWVVSVSRPSADHVDCVVHEREWDPAQHDREWEVEITPDAIRIGPERAVWLEGPLVAGHSWPYQTTNNTGGVLADGTATIASTSTTVVVPAGTFSGCLRVEYEESGEAGDLQYHATSTWWICPGIGPVQEESHRAWHCLGESWGYDWWAPLGDYRVVELRITKARMVSRSGLGVDLHIKYLAPDLADDELGIKLSGTVNGTPVSQDFDITGLVEPVDDKDLPFDYGQSRRRSGRVLDFAKAGVPRFETDQEIENLTGLVTSNIYGLGEWSFEPTPAPEPVEIVLPVVIVHGYPGDEWFWETLGPVSYPLAYDPLRTYLRDQTQGDFVSGYTSDDTWYKTLWGAPVETYKHRRWDGGQVAQWLDKVIAKAVDQRKGLTYAKRVNLVAHSMGGLIARYYVTAYGESGRVHKVITIGTPHAGTTTAWITLSNRGYTAREVDKRMDQQPLIRWAIPQYPALLDASTHEIVWPDPGIVRKGVVRGRYQVYPEEWGDEVSPPEGVSYYSIYNWAHPTPYQLLVMPAESARDPMYTAVGLPSQDLGDRMVLGLQSGELASANSIAVAVETRHGMLATDPDVQACVLAALREGEPGW
jgi:pimeloyl-ACP methyl ester carboxylesterase